MGVIGRLVIRQNIPMVCFLQAAAEAGLPSSLQFDAERSRAGCPLGAWWYPRRDDSLACAQSQFLRTDVRHTEMTPPGTSLTARDCARLGKLYRN
jgi:hypothetical protein